MEHFSQEAKGKKSPAGMVEISLGNVCQPNPGENLLVEEFLTYHLQVSPEPLYLL